MKVGKICIGILVNVERIVDYFFLIVTEFQKFKNLTVCLVTSMYYL